MLETISTKVKAAAIPLTVFMVFSLSAAVFGAKKSSLNSDLRSVEKKIRFYRKEIREKEGQRRTVTGQLYATQRRLGAAQSSLSRNKLRLMDAEADLAETKQRLERTQKQLDRRESLLKGRVIDIYEGEGLDYVNVVLGAANMWSFLTRAYYLQRILDQDATLINQIRKDKGAIEKDKAHQTEKVAEIAAINDRLELERNKIAALADSKRQSLNNIEHSKELMEDALDELEAKSREIEAQIRRLQKTAKGRARYARKLKGGLAMPCSGPITSRFGYRVHPITKVYKLHTGVDIAVPTGTAVRSAADGEVIMSGWMGAYGYAVVIDHGSGISTLYGHNSRLCVRVGQQVKKGQTIAKSGSTGYSTGPHVHFEKRVDGKPVNPL